jgi:hypothetical protein
MAAEALREAGCGVRVLITAGAAGSCVVDSVPCFGLIDV